MFKEIKEVIFTEKNDNNDLAKNKEKFKKWNQMEILKLKSIITEMKNSLDGMNQQLIWNDTKTNELEDTLVEII